MVVEAIRVKEINAYRDDGNYYNFYVDCPYCSEKNDLRDDDNRGYFICGKCNKPFYVR